MPMTVDHTTCALYTPGHQVHFIQARLSAEDDPVHRRMGKLLALDDNGWITVDVDGELLRFWNHDPGRARACFATSSGNVVLASRGLLHAPHEGGRCCMCITTDAPTPCMAAPAAGSELADQVMTHGGILVSADELRTYLSANHPGLPA